VASLRDLDQRAQSTARAFVRALQAAGVSVTVTSTRRDASVQAGLYADYMAGRSRYPAAPPGRSTHGLGLAFDLKLNPPVYAAAGAAWERAGFTWGGRFKDQIHFDFRPHA
jgi:LAS superfamily LD-carboxypeptidase LdcB